MPFRITVTKLEPAPAQAVDHPTPMYVETEIYCQTVDELNLSKFVLALNKQPRVRKSRPAGSKSA